MISHLGMNLYKILHFLDKGLKNEQDGKHKGELKVVAMDTADQLTLTVLRKNMMSKVNQKVKVKMLTFYVIEDGKSSTKEVIGDNKQIKNDQHFL